jgi:hypothetical protein
MASPTAAHRAYTTRRLRGRQPPTRIATAADSPTKPQPRANHSKLVTSARVCRQAKWSLGCASVRECPLRLEPRASSLYLPLRLFHGRGARPDREGPCSLPFRCCAASTLRSRRSRPLRASARAESAPAPGRNRDAPQRFCRPGRGTFEVRDRRGGGSSQERRHLAH